MAMRPKRTSVGVLLAAAVALSGCSSILPYDGPLEREVLGEAEFVAALGRATAVWDERLGEVSVLVDDGLATAWMAYRFYAGDAFSHCGVNAMQLVQDAEGWRILNLVDTRRRACE